MPEIRPPTYSGAAALVELHDRYLRTFLEDWLAASERGVEMPEGDPNCASLEAVLVHVMGCSARYLNWICAQLGLPERVAEDRPAADGFAHRAKVYMESVLAAWAQPLDGLTEERAYGESYPSRWGPPYCLDAMLEHAVMHPIRHSRQLRRLMA